MQPTFPYSHLSLTADSHRYLKLVMVMACSPRTALISVSRSCIRRLSKSDTPTPFQFHHQGPPVHSVGINRSHLYNSQFPVPNIVPINAIYMGVKGKTQPFQLGLSGTVSPTLDGISRTDQDSRNTCAFTEPVRDSNPELRELFLES